METIREETVSQTSNEKVSQTEPQSNENQQVSIKDIKIENENIALNVLVGMVNIAQKRGAFSLEESSKAWECVQLFMKPQQSQ
tara:strand:- start:12651 stop:12899 length:249 start_codon:yes stop_codon:yes gene_type:complete